MPGIILLVLMMNSILVTGANGFVGKALSRHLKEQGLHVRALLRRKADGPWDEVVYCELGRDPVPATAMQGVDCVFHLAGVAHVNEVDDEVYEKVNVRGTEDLIAAATTSGVPRFVLFSSVKATADPPDEDCVDESWDRPPENAYGRSKREAEYTVLKAAARAGMHAVVLRPTLVYGPGVKGNLEKVIRLVATGLCPPLPDTRNRRSMIHVHDLCELALKVAEHPDAAGKRYIVADRRAYSTHELYAGILESLCKPVPSWSVPPIVLRAAGRVGDIGGRLLRQPVPLNSGMISRLLDSACYSSALCQKEMDWQPRHDLIGSIPEMVGAWKEEREESGHRQGFTRS